MWLLLAFLSATLLGFYDVFKKQSLKDNAVLPVLFLNTFFSSLVFLPFILLSVYEPDLLGGTIFNVPVAGWEQHKYIIIKSFIVLSSWIFGYFGLGQDVGAGVPIGPAVFLVFKGVRVFFAHDDSSLILGSGK